MKSWIVRVSVFPGIPQGEHYLFYVIESYSRVSALREAAVRFTNWYGGDPTSLNVEIIGEASK